MSTVSKAVVSYERHAYQIEDQGHGIAVAEVQKLIEQARTDYAAAYGDRAQFFDDWLRFYRNDAGVFAWFEVEGYPEPEQIRAALDRVDAAVEQVLADRRENPEPFASTAEESAPPPQYPQDERFVGAGVFDKGLERALAEAGAATFGNLAGLTERELLGIKGIGEPRLVAVKKALAARGMRLMREMSL